jgi:protein-disulfide isomerase
MATAGNSTDLDVCDLAAFQLSMPECRAIALAVEGLRDGRRLLTLGEMARAAGKPIVAMKLGRGETGAKAAMSHTGSMAGSTAAWSAAFRRAGMLEVEDFDALLETAGFMAKAPKPKARGVGIATPSGGAGIMAADHAEYAGLALPQPMEATAAVLRSAIPDFGSPRNPCDLTAQVAELAAVPAAAEQQAPAAAAEPAEQPAAAAPEIGAAPALPEGTSVPVGVDSTGAVLIGDANATQVVEVYVDYQCPFCQKWEKEIGTALVERALLPDSGLLVKQYNLAFLGEQSPTLDPPGASARAANAATCVLEGEGTATFAAFNAAVFESAEQAEPASVFSTEALSSIASELGAGRSTITCIEANRHVPFVAASTQAGFGRGVGGTPTVLVNGRTLENPFEDAELNSLAAG